jgi:hypothetical protein
MAGLNRDARCVQRTTQCAHGLLDCIATRTWRAARCASRGLRCTLRPRQTPRKNTPTPSISGLAALRLRG